MNILTDLIPIPCTDRDKINQLRLLLVEIQASWFDNLFDSGLTFSTPEIFEKMQEAVCLLERRDNPSQKGVDLKAIASDYALLERIFIAAEWSTEEYNHSTFDSSTVRGCDLVQLHRFSAVRILQEVVEYQSTQRAQKLMVNESTIIVDSDDRSTETRIVDSYPDDWIIDESNDVAE